MKTNYFLFFEHKIIRNIIKKIVFFCLIFILCYDNVFSQEEKQRNNYEVSLGMHYCGYFGNKHIRFRPRNQAGDPNILTYTPYGGFDYQNNLSYDAAFSYNYFFSANLFTSIGFLFSKNKEIVKSSPDTVIYYNSLYEYHRLITAYHKSYYNIGLQGFIGYNYKKYFVKTGLAFDFFKIIHKQETEIPGNTLNRPITTNLSKYYSRVFERQPFMSASLLTGWEIFTTNNGSKVLLSSGATFYLKKIYISDKKISLNNYFNINLMINYSF